MKDDTTKTILCKTVRQYNKSPVHEENMIKLLEIAEDYKQIKNQVYQRYGGIKSLPKIYPGYTVQNEMTQSGLRERLHMPSVYFYLAVFDALGDIKTQWTQVRNGILKSIKNKTDFSPEDCHYVRFVLSIDSCFKDILLNQEVELPEKLKGRYAALSVGRNTGKLNGYIQRQVRKRLRRLHTDTAGGFSISERAYRYGDHGIYISVKEKRKRVFIELTDNNRYERQLYIRLHPEKGNLEIHVPIETRIKRHADYSAIVGLALGMSAMLTTDEGHIYGVKYGEYQQALTEHIVRNGGKDRSGIKYSARKEKLEASLHTYVNQEINRLIREEKPQTLFIPKFPQSSAGGVNSEINRAVSVWQRGYIRKRLNQKAAENSIRLEEVFAKGISRECSFCGGQGDRRDGIFYCRECKELLPERVNAAKNALKRGMEQQKDMNSK